VVAVVAVVAGLRQWGVSVAHPCALGRAEPRAWTPFYCAAAAAAAAVVTKSFEEQTTEQLRVALLQASSFALGTLKLGGGWGGRWARGCVYVCICVCMCVCMCVRVCLCLCV